jgi:hypothetical protein
MLMALFGPSAGSVLGIPAFLATVTIVPILNFRLKRRTLRPIVNSHQGLYRLRPLLWFLMALCVLIAVSSMITMLASSGDAGVAEGTRPVFDTQPEYRLNSHGRHTVVTRTRYRIVGASSVVGWHTLGILFALVGLHLSLFGQYPPLLERNPRSR